MKTTSREAADGYQLNIAPVRMLPLNPRRLAFLIVNLGAAVSFISPSSGPSATKGILLSALGGSYACIYNEDFELVCREWYGSAAADLNACYWFEVLVQG